MKLEEYRASVRRLIEEHQWELAGLAKNFALANNPVQVGDIIDDHYQRLRVDKIQIAPRDVPTCVYTGVLLNKKDQPKMKGRSNPKPVVGNIWQNNLKKINNKEINDSNTPQQRL